MPNQQPPAWLAALPALFAIGAKMGGSTPAATGALQGADRANLLADHQRQQLVQESQHQQQFELQQQAMQERQAQMAEAVELRRAQAIKSSIDDLRAGTWKNKQEYDDAVGANEQMLGQHYGVRPNMLRSAVPYNGPTVESRGRQVMETLTKQKNWQDIITSNGLVKFDRDEDGIEESVPVMELASLAKFPIARDPQTGQPMLPPKEVKAENVQEYDQVYAGVLAEFAAEGKDVKDPKVQGLAATKARTRISAASKTGNASVQVVMPERPMTRYQKFTAERGLRSDAEKLLAPAREMNRQVTVMRTGLDEARRTGRLGPGTQAVINSFNRIMEPGSVTREAEYLRSTAGQPLLQALQGRIDAIKAGGPGVTLQTLEETVELAERIAEETSAFADTPLSMIGEQATEYGLPVDQITPPKGSYRLKPRVKKAAGPQPAPEAPPVSGKGGGFSVVAPNGKTYTFPSQAQLDAFKRATGAK